MLHDLLSMIEDSAKPVVIATHGAALGGVLNWPWQRIIGWLMPQAQLGQPEVNLAIIPGAGGTQRLPRLVGVEKAIQVCVTGSPLSAHDALMAGLIDGVVENDVLGEAVALARRAGGTVRTRDRVRRLGTPEANAPLFEAGRQLAARSRRNQIAPLRAIEAIEAATTLAFEDGCQRELEIFRECIVSDQAKALFMRSCGARRGKDSEC